VDNFLQTLRNLGTVRLVAMAGVAVGLIAFFIFLTLRLNTTQMSLLFAELDPNDSGKIVTQLEGSGIPYQLRAGGRQILVPSDQVLRLRMQMAESGLPNGGSVGYEIFDKSESLGTTNFVQNINLVRALEGELARTIRAINKVEEARVHLVMPKRELFSRQKQEPSASVVVKTQGHVKLPKAQVLAIQHLIASAVPGLSPRRISIIDGRGRLLARAGEEDPEGEIVAEDADDIRLGYENRLQRAVEALVEQSVGLGNVRAQVSVEMDFDRISTNTESFDPDGQVVRSTQSVEESANSTDKTSQSTVSVGNNLPDADADSDNGSSSSRSNRTEETVNYEITKTVKSHVRESGSVRRLSVAVLVNGTFNSDEDGNRIYQPRTKEEMDQLTALVQSAIGYDEKRGDKLELINMRFTNPDDLIAPAEGPLFGLTKSDYFRIGEIFVLAIVGILVILLVVRPLIARTLDALPSALEAAKERTLLSDQSEDAPALAGPTGTGVSGPLSDEPESMIDLDRVEGRVKASTLKKIGEIVERHPEETVGIIRQWMFAD
jgi:flagellar M-ring protein FliF